MLLRALALLSLLVLPLCVAGPFRAGEYTLSCPYTHGNLTVWFVVGQDRLPGRQYLTLAEALEQKKVIVHETGNVNELAIENLSDTDVYVQWGDIVKGGQQDRTIGNDLIVSKSMGKVAIASFCVEQGRWTRRGDEDAGQFASAGGYVCGKDLKLAANASLQPADQQRVWDEVSKHQAQLSQNAGASVASSASPSSLQLSLENEAVKKSIQQYEQAMNKSLEEWKAENPIGFVYAVNGKIAGGDVYGSGSLFAMMWPKLLGAVSAEAFSELEKGKSFDMPKNEDVAQCLESLAGGKSREKALNDRTKMCTLEAATLVRVETLDTAGNNFVHRGYITREAAPTTRPAGQPSAPQNNEGLQRKW